MRVDEEADAFFKLGDEGMYAGGPHSVAPLSRDSDDEHDLAVGITTEQLERRDRLKRLVTTLVGVLGAVVMVLLPFKLGAFGPAPRPSQPVVAKLPSPIPPAPAAARATEPSPALATPVAIARAVVVSESTLPSHPAGVAPSLTAPISPVAPAPAQERHRVPATARRAGADRAVAVRPSNHSRGPARALAPSHASRGLHIPPTASFPD